jgi:hypothetical protein
MKPGLRKEKSAELEEGAILIDKHLNGLMKVASLKEVTIRASYGLDGEGRFHRARNRRRIEQHVRYEPLGKRSQLQKVDYAPYSGTKLWTEQVVEGEDGRFDVKKVLVKGVDEKPVAFLLEQTSKHNKVLEEGQSRKIWVDKESLEKHWSVI